MPYASSTTPSNRRLGRRLLPILAVAGLIGPSSGAAPSGETTPAEPEVVSVDLGPDQRTLDLPVGETLRYRATLRTALADIDVGSVELSAGLDPYRRSLLAAASNRGQSDTPWVRARAFGDYTLYVMDARLETRFQDQTWPFSVHKYNHEGTEKRRRELLTGEKGGQWTVSYRGDTSRGAPEGLRIWGDTREQSVPRGALDSLSAVYLVRSAVAAGETSLRFHMLDKLRIWDVQVTLGPTQELETPAGTFRGRVVQLATERVDPEALAEAENSTDADGEGTEFAGPFGIKGNIELWLEETTGIPLLIKGELPVLLGDLTVDMTLEGYEGTPSGFAPLSANE